MVKVQAHAWRGSEAAKRYPSRKDSFDQMSFINDSLRFEQHRINNGISDKIRSWYVFPNFLRHVNDRMNDKEV